MALVHLIRHARHGDYGRVLSGRSDIPLSPEGRAQAEALAASLAPLGLTHLHTSPRPRARETATAIGSAAGLEPEVVPALEEIDFGAWTGRSFDELGPEPGWRRWNERRSQGRPPGGESQTEATARALAHVEAFAAANPQARAAMVSHADVIRGVVAHGLGVGGDGILRFDVDAASLSTLAVEAWGVRIIGLNVKGWEWKQD